MLNFCRSRMLLGAVLALSSTTWAASGSVEGYLQQKGDAIRPLSVSLVERHGAATLEESVSRASSLYGLHVDSSSTMPTIEVHLSKSTELGLHKSDRGIVVDLANTIVLDDLRKMMIDGGHLLEDVTVQQAGVSPHFAARLTITTTDAFSVKVTRIGDHLKLTLTAPDLTQDAAFAALMDAEQRDYVAAVTDEYTLRRSAAINSLATAFDELATKLDQATQSAKLKLLQAELAGAATQSGNVKGAIESTELRLNTLRTEFKQATRLLDQGADTSVEAGLARVDSALATMNRLRTAVAGELEESSRIRAQVAQLSPTASGAASDLAELDRAMAAVKTVSSEGIAADDSLAAFDVALESVGAATPELPLDETASAAVRVTTKTASDMPPSKRTTPSVHSLTSPAIDVPARMTMLSATSGASQAAADEGMLLMAQAEDLTNESRPEGEVAEYTPTRHRLQRTQKRPDFNLYNENLPPEEDPLRQLVNIDFKDMDLANVVALLANKGQINVIAGTEISGSVTANLKEIPLGRAIEIVLRMNGLGIVEEAGVYRITTYEEAVASRQDTELIFLQTAEAEAVRQTLDQIIQGQGGADTRIRIGANTQSNILVLTGPRDRVNELIEVIEELDVAEPVIPTVNRVVEINYANPADIAAIVEPILSENGRVASEDRAGQVIVTDIPVKIEEISGLIQEIDVPEEQVSIEAMVVDTVINDSSRSGVDLSLGLTSAFPFQTFAGGGDEEGSGVVNFPELTGGTQNLGGPGTGQMSFGFVRDDFQLAATISAEVQNGNAELLANPVIMTLENQPAEINITDEIPYTTIDRQDDVLLFTVEFKEVGTLLNVTPKVTFDRKIVTTIEAEQSTLSSFITTGAGQTPVTSQREASTTMRMNNGQTVYIAGLRRYDSSDDDTKVPVLGDIPLLSTFFKNQSRQKRDTELMVFLTCNIVEDDFPELTPYQKQGYDRLGGIDPDVDINVTRDLLQGHYKQPLRDPIYKWRRPK